MCRYLSRLNVLIFACAVAISQLTGCSFSASSESSSDSSASLSDSASSIISSPSSVSGKTKKYVNDVADYTAAYVKSSEPGADYSSFRKGLSEIAEKRGIANWDQQDSTYVAIGKGLKKGGVEGSAYEIYKKNLGNSNSQYMQNIEKGYESE